MTLLGTAGDVLPIVIFIGVFQVFVIRRPLKNVRSLLFGLVLTILGLGIFLIGLERRCSRSDASWHDSSRTLPSLPRLPMRW